MIHAFPLSAVLMPKITSAVSVRPEPSRPARPTISPGRTCRSNGAMVPFTVAFKRRYRFIAQQGTARPLQGIVVQFATQHHFHQLNLRQLAGLAAADEAAVTQHGDAVADRIDWSRKWVTKIRLTPLSLSWRIRVNSISTSWVSRLAVGSSRISTLADRSMARQIATICCIATEKRFSGSRTSRGKAVGGHQRRRPGLHLFTSQQTKPPRLTADEQVIRHRHIGQQVHFLGRRCRSPAAGHGRYFWAKYLWPSSQIVPRSAW